MNDMSWEIAESNIFTFLVAGFVILIIFRIVSGIAKVLPLRRKHIIYLNHYLPGTEIAAWVIFLIWASQYLWHGNRLIAVLVFIVLLLLTLWWGWFALKDYVAGAIFRSSKAFHEGQMVRIGEYRGTIQSFSGRKLILETPEGETIHFPYSKISHAIISKINPAELIKHKTFRLTMTREKSLEETRGDIHRKIMNLPWASVKKSPIITPIEDSPSQYTFEITVYSLETEYLFKIEEHLRKKFEGE